MNNGFMFSAVPSMMVVIFIIIISIFIINALKSIKQWNYNNAQPVLIVKAKVIGKRTEVRRRASNNNLNHTYTSYYVTFEVESEDRIELHVNGKEYGMLIENDIGKLKFQGTRYLGFERTKY